MDTTRDLKDRCQSCGMPLRTGEQTDTSFYGTEADGKPSSLYCKFCYAQGAFTNPAETLESMMEKSVGHMTRVLKVPAEQAKEMSRKVIPQLGRWNG